MSKRNARRNDSPMHLSNRPDGCSHPADSMRTFQRRYPILMVCLAIIGCGGTATTPSALPPQFIHVTLNAADNRGARHLEPSYLPNTMPGILTGGAVNHQTADDFRPPFTTAIRTVSWQGGYCGGFSLAGAVPPPPPIHAHSLSASIRIRMEAHVCPARSRCKKSPLRQPMRTSSSDSTPERALALAIDKHLTRATAVHRRSTDAISGHGGDAILAVGASRYTEQHADQLGVARGSAGQQLFGVLGPRGKPSDVHSGFGILLVGSVGFANKSYAVFLCRRQRATWDFDRRRFSAAKGTGQPPPAVV